MTRPLSFVFLGLSVTSSWGNGHATTYRGLLRELKALGHEILFLERDVPWYAANRDLPSPAYCRTELYTSLSDLKARFTGDVRRADMVIVGSYVPEGVDVGRWATDEAAGATAFYDIDTPVTIAALNSGRCEYLSRDLTPRFDIYLSFSGGETLTVLEQEFGSPFAAPFYCSVDPALYYPEDAALRWDLGYLGTYSPDRQPALEERLIRPALSLPDSRFAAAGPQYPPDIDWPANVERREHLAPAAHRSFYCSQKFTLNITRRDMVRAGYSPSVRIFEAAACGVPIISDYWEGLDSVLKIGSETLVAHTAGDVVGYLRDYPEADRRALARRARERVLANHTAAHRARQLVGYYRRLSGSEERKGDCVAVR